MKPSRDTRLQTILRRLDARAARAETHPSYYRLADAVWILASRNHKAAILGIHHLRRMLRLSRRCLDRLSPSERVV